LDAFDRLIYMDSQDEPANGKARVPYEIRAYSPGSCFFRKRTALSAALVFIAPGISMISRRQEFLEDDWFCDIGPIDWTKKEMYCGIYTLYRDLIR
jgi:1,4-alpha-glucan branching enzyme